MKKVLPLVLFCIAIFGVAALAMLYKQAHDLKSHDANGEGEEATAHAGMGGESPPPGENHPAEGGGNHDGAKPAGGTEDWKREQAIGAGRTLFEVPSPISIAEISDLMTDLTKQRHGLEIERSALDLREEQLNGFEKEIEERRQKVTELAEQVQAALPTTTTAAADEALDPVAFTTLAQILSAAVTSNGSGRSASEALANMTPDRAARVLVEMESETAGKILGELAPEKMIKVTDALLKLKLPAKKKGS